MCHRFVIDAIDSAESLFVVFSARANVEEQPQYCTLPRVSHCIPQTLHSSVIWSQKKRWFSFFLDSSRKLDIQSAFSASLGSWRLHPFLGRGCFLCNDWCHCLPPETQKNVHFTGQAHTRVLLHLSIYTFIYLFLLLVLLFCGVRLNSTRLFLHLQHKHHKS